MKKNLDLVLMDYNGQPLRDGPPKYKRDAAGAVVYDTITSEPVILEPAKSATLGGVAFAAMRSALGADAQLTGDEKVKLHRLTHLLAKGGEVDLSTEQWALVKKRICDVFDFTTYGACHDLIEAE